MGEVESPFAGMDLREVLRLSDGRLAAAVRPADAVIAAEIRAQAVQYIREGADTWPTSMAVPVTSRELREFRAQRHVSQEWLGRRVGGVNAQTVSKWEREEVPIPVDMQSRLRAILGLIADAEREEVADHVEME
jgi:DNA-binding transcriptional regulator YiaG